MSSDNELSFKNLIAIIFRFWRFLLSKWVILCVMGIIGGVLGIVYSYFKEPQYEATLSFSTQDDETSGAGGFAGIAAQFGVNLGGVSGVFSGDNILSLIESRKMVIATLLLPVNQNGKQNSLLNIYLDANHYTEAFKKSDSLKDLSFPLNQDQKTFSRVQDSILLTVADGIIKYSLKADKPDKNLQIYTIDCITNNEFFSYEFTRQIINQVSTFYIDTKTKQSQQTVDVIQKRTDSIKHAFDYALEGRATLSDANINAALQVPQIGVEKKQTDITVLATAYGELLKNLELARFNLLNQTPYIQIIDEPILPLKMLRLGKLVGAVIFGFIFGVLTIFFLVVRRFFQNEKRNTIETV